MEILDVISKMKETMYNYGAEPKHFIMHPSTAEKILENLIGGKYDITPYCQPESVYVTQQDPREYPLRKQIVGRPKAHWIETDPATHGVAYECSVCGHAAGFKFNFCSDCGSDMRETPGKEE